MGNSIYIYYKINSISFIILTIVYLNCKLYLIRIQHTTFYYFVSYIKTLSPAHKREPILIHIAKGIPVAGHLIQEIASIGQEGLYSVNLVDAPGSAYNTIFSTIIVGTHCVNDIKSFFDNFTNRHATCRATFKRDKNKLLININETINDYFGTINGENFSNKELKSAAEQFYNQVFNLETGPLFKVCLIKCNPQKTILLVCTHHVISDGFSLQILIDEFYKWFTDDKHSTNTIDNYLNFCKWQNTFPSSESGRSQRRYWHNKLSDNLSTLNFTSKCNSTKNHKYSGDIYQFTICKEMFCKIESLTKENKISLFSFFMTIFQILLHKYTNQKDILIGHPTSGRMRSIEGRKRSEYNNNFGYFVNPIIFRNSISDKISFLSLLNNTNMILKEDFKNQDYPFSKLYSDLNLREKGLDLPQVVLNFQKRRNDHRDLAAYKFNIKKPTPIKVNNFELQPFYLPQQLGSTDLEWEVLESKEKIYCNLKYRNNLFKKENIQGMSKHITHIISEVINYPKKKISEIHMLPSEELNQLLNEFNKPINKECQHYNLTELIKNTINSYYSNIGIKYRNKTLSFSELDVKSNALAKKLQLVPISQNDKVALMFNRSPEMVISMIAVLKVGGSFIPIDPQLPKNRITFMLSDSTPKLILTNDKNVEELSQISHLYVDQNNLSVDDSEIKIKKTNPTLTPAYTIYTSGSTGKPKGATNTHSGLSNMILDLSKKLNITTSDNILQFASYSFDASVYEIFLSLLTGATLTIIEKEATYNLDLFKKEIENKKVTSALLPPVFLNKLGKYKFKSLTKLVTGGESAIKDDALFHSSYLDYYNAYGPTETSIIATLCKVNSQNLSSDNIPIGKPISNINIRILTREGQLCPIGFPGEICISGIGVGLGYLNRAKLTKEKFIWDPYSKDTPMYKTGDLGKWNYDGNIVFLGRIDNQVKVSGYRIELGEIEQNLNKIEEIIDSTVITRKKDNETNIFAFIKISKSIKRKKIKQILSTTLPFYMIPREIIVLSEFPLTNSGKKDTEALLELIDEKKGSPYICDYTQSSAELIDSIRKIWSEVILNSNPTDESNFFDIGGNSLQVAELKDKISKHIGRDIEITDLFKHTTIRSQAKLIQEMSVDIVSSEPALYSNSITFKNTKKDIAVIGMAGKFPGAKNIDEFWENLINCKESITQFTKEELLDSGISEELLNSDTYIKSKGIIEDIDKFDAEFFGYSPRDAELIDPQQRLFLEQSYLALEDAGYNAKRYKGKIGIFASCSHNTYFTNNIMPNFDVYGKDYYSILTGNEKDFIATRVAYKLNLKGPAQTIQTACSSSLVGVHLACESIMNGSSDIAMAGGVSITLPVKSGYSYTKDGIGSSDGHCRPFDSNSEGTVPGNGVGVVVLKSYDEAVKDKDHIFAIIKGSAINNDGSDKIGFMAPSVTGQENVIKDAILKADIKPEMISHIEAHGTGTKLGDPIEIKALTSAFNTSKKQFCSIGSVKANVGHLDAAAGITGFIKATLTLYNQKIPPAVNYSSSNPEINFENTPFFVNKEIVNLTKNKHYVGVSSLGLGGTNAHVIIQNVEENLKNGNRKLSKKKFSRKRFWIKPKGIESTISKERAEKPKDWFYAPIWKPTIQSNKDKVQELRKIDETWLVFRDDNGLGDLIAKQIQDSGNKVTTVSFRKIYSEMDFHYSIDPFKKEDYDSLFRSLKSKNQLPDRIVHLPLVTGDRLKSLTENNLKPISYLGFYSLLFTAKALQHINFKKCKITVLSDHVFSVNGEDWINPLKSTVIGPINVIPQEHPGITCQHIDISIESNKRNIYQLSHYILDDLINFKKETTIAYRNHRRWEKSYEKLDIIPGEVNLEEDNIYFISGGLGGIGLKIATDIAETKNVTLILSGKNVLPPEDKWDHILEKYQDKTDPLLKKIIKIKKIRSLGSRVITLCTDLQNRVEFTKSLADIELCYGKINGVIHAAGTAGNQLISTKTIEDVENVFDPKIKGTLYLQSYFSHHKLDFFLLFSSLSSISGGIEQVAYSSANAFLDAVAAHNFSDRHLQTLAINWPGWKDTGMTIKMKNYENLKHLQDTYKANAISPKDGVEVLKLCLSLGPVYRLIISPENFNEWRKNLNKNLDIDLHNNNLEVQNRPDLSTSLIEAHNNDQAQMIKLWESILHISPIGIEDNFFDLGGHSLLGLELLAQIAEIKKTSLQLNDLYENPTIQSLVSFINQKELLNPLAEFKIKRSKIKETNLIVPLRNGNSNKSLYLFQPAGVNIFFYQQLASTISSEINVYGVRLTDVEEGHDIDPTIEGIAIRCANQILMHTKDNTINLAGSSFGGVVAFEVSKILKRHKRNIGLLSLFDSPGPEHLPKIPKDDAEILHRIFSQWVSLSLSILKQEKTFHNQCRYIMSIVQQDTDTGLIMTPDQIELLLSISKNSIKALEVYNPTSTNDSILFIKPLDFHPNYDKNPERAWRKLTDNKFIIKNVPGDHLSMNSHPNVSHIGKILSKELS